MTLEQFARHQNDWENKPRFRGRAEHLGGACLKGVSNDTRATAVPRLLTHASSEAKN